MAECSLPQTLVWLNAVYEKDAGPYTMTGKKQVSSILFD